jgi:hypothetical protein
MDFGLTTFFECPLKRFSASRAFIGFDFARRHQPPNRCPPGEIQMARFQSVAGGFDPSGNPQPVVNEGKPNERRGKSDQR